jgi:hypothetical protein
MMTLAQHTDRLRDLVSTSSEFPKAVPPVWTVLTYLPLALAGQLFPRCDSCAYPECRRKSRHLGDSRAPRMDRRKLVR